MATPYHRVSVYLDDPSLRQKIKIAAALRDVSSSEYCLDAIRLQLEKDGMLPPSTAKRRAAARRMDKVRAQIGPIGIPVSELIREGRRR